MSVRGISLAVVLLALLVSGTALAQAFANAPSATPAPLELVFEPSAATLPAERIRAAIAKQLNAEVVSGADTSQHALRIGTSEGGRNVVLLYPVRGELLQRSLPWNGGAGDAVERVALLAQNLVQDQTDLLLAPDAGSPAPAATPSPPAPAPAVKPLAGTAVGARRSAPTRVPTPPSAGPAVQLTVQLALFNQARLADDLRSGAARGTAGLLARFELPVHANLALGLAPALEHWEGAVRGEDLLISPSDFMDVQLWARPRWLLGALELSLPLGIGPSLMEELDSSDPGYALVLPDQSRDEDAFPPRLGLVATAQLQALYWLGESIGVLVELGVEYHRATGREHEGLALTLNLIQPKAAIGVSFAF